MASASPASPQSTPESGPSIDPWGNRGLRWFWRKPASGLPERTRRRVTLHLMPFLFFLYVLAYLDRINISVAALSLGKAAIDGGLGFSYEVIGFGGSMFFFGYWILEIPSTLTVERRGARWVFVRILVLWGLCAAVMGAMGTPAMNRAFTWLPRVSAADWGWFSGFGRLVNGLREGDAEQQFYLFRFLLGFFEGGFFPSVILYLSHWFRTEDRARALGLFTAAIPLTSVLGMPLSGLLLHVEWLGLPGWRWIFILEGIAPILAGVATAFMLPSRPAQARWLSPEERDWLVGELERERERKKQPGHFAWKHHVVAVLLLTGVYFCQNVTSYGLSTFMPSIMRSQLVSLPESLQARLGIAHYAPWQVLERELLAVRNEFAVAEKQNSAVEPARAAELRARLDQIAEAKRPLEASEGFDEEKAWGERLASYLAALPYLMGFLALLINGRLSDRSGERIWHTAIPLALCSLGILAAALLQGNPLGPTLVMIFVVGTCVYAHLPAFWPIPTIFLGASAAAASIGFINMIGNLGSAAGQAIVGKAAQGELSFAPALLKIWPWSICGAGIVLAMHFYRRAVGGKS